MVLAPFENSLSQPQWARLCKTVVCLKYRWVRLHFHSGFRRSGYGWVAFPCSSPDVSFGTLFFAHFVGVGDLRDNTSRVICLLHVRFFDFRIARSGFEKILLQMVLIAPCWIHSLCIICVLHLLAIWTEKMYDWGDVQRKIVEELSTGDFNRDQKILRQFFKALLQLWQRDLDDRAPAKKHSPEGKRARWVPCRGSILIVSHLTKRWITPFRCTSAWPTNVHVCLCGDCLFH